MKRFAPRRPGPWLTRHPLLARAVALLMILTCWAWFPLVAAWDNREDLASILSELVPMAFLPWRKRE